MSSTTTSTFVKNLILISILLSPSLLILTPSPVSAAGTTFIYECPINLDCWVSQPDSFAIHANDTSMQYTTYSDGVKVRQIMIVEFNTTLIPDSASIQTVAFNFTQASDLTRSGTWETRFYNCTSQPTTHLWNGTQLFALDGTQYHDKANGFADGSYNLSVWDNALEADVEKHLTQDWYAFYIRGFISTGTEACGSTFNTST